MSQGITQNLSSYDSQFSPRLQTNLSGLTEPQVMFVKNKNSVMVENTTSKNPKVSEDINWENRNEFVPTADSGLTKSREQGTKPDEITSDNSGSDDNTKNFGTLEDPLLSRKIQTRRKTRWNFCFVFNIFYFIVTTIWLIYGIVIMVEYSSASKDADKHLIPFWENGWTFIA